MDNVQRKWKKHQFWFWGIILLLFCCSTAGCVSAPLSVSQNGTTAQKKLDSTDPMELQVIMQNGELKKYSKEAVQTVINAGRHNNGAAGQGIALHALLGQQGKLPVAIYTQEGNIVDCTDLQIVIRKDQPYLCGGGQSLPWQAVAGVVIDPLSHRITAVAQLITQQMKKEQPVLLIYLDGFGYNIYQHAKAKGLLPNIGRLQCMEKALTVYPPITPVVYAAMLTGQTPAQTGIRSRADHVLQCTTVLHHMITAGKKVVVVEGDQQIIPLEGQIILNTDRNGNGLTDEEILTAALNRLGDAAPDLLVVHFHSIDDVSHQYGPDAKETLQQVAWVDAAVSRLLAKWPAKFLIVADHGQHRTTDKGRLGNHGEFCSDDLFIPIISGGMANEK